MKSFRLPTLPVRMPPSESTHNTFVVVCSLSLRLFASRSSRDEGDEDNNNAASAAVGPPPVELVFVSGGGPAAGLGCVVVDDLLAAWLASGIVLRPCRQSNTQMLGVSNHRRVKRGHLK